MLVMGTNTGDDESIDSKALEAEIASSVHAHVRTVERRFLGLKGKGKVAQRVNAALASRGLRVHCGRVSHRSEPPRAADLSVMPRQA